MSITTLSSRQFSQDASMAKRAALDGPVYITDRGRPSHVLMTMAYFKKMGAQPAKKTDKIADLLAMPGIDELAFDIPIWQETARAAQLD